MEGKSINQIKYMGLDKKYDIKPEVVKQMVRDGVISASVKNQYDVYDYYCQCRAKFPGMGIWDTYAMVAQDLKMNFDTVRHVCYRIGKKS